MASLLHIATNGPDDPTMAPAGVRRRGTGRALPRRGTRMAERFAKGMVVAVLYLTVQLAALYLVANMAVRGFFVAP